MAWARKKDSGGRNGKEITPFPPPKRMSAPPGESQEERFRLLTDCITVGPTHSEVCASSSRAEALLPRLLTNRGAGNTLCFHFLQYSVGPILTSCRGNSPGSQHLPCLCHLSSKPSIRVRKEEDKLMVKRKHNGEGEREKQRNAGH